MILPEDPNSSDLRGAKQVRCGAGRQRPRARGRRRLQSLHPSRAQVLVAVAVDVNIQSESHVASVKVWSRVGDSNSRGVSPPVYKTGAVATEPTRLLVEAGFEPTTSRLSAGCSTLKYSTNT